MKKVSQSVEPSTRSSKNSIASALTNPAPAYEYDYPPSTYDELSTLMVVPPDGGWGWVVMVAAFGCNFIVDGIVSSFGMYMQVISEEFQVTIGAVSLVSSLLTGCQQITGPIISGLANKYGFRKVAFAGGLIGCAGFGLSYMATNVTVLYLVYGVLGGIGLGLLYVPSVLIVSFYFARWRALTCCVAMLGSSVGGSVMPTAIEKLIGKFGWRTTMLFQAGMMSIACMITLLYRPLKPVRLTRRDTHVDLPQTGGGLHARIISQDSILSDPRPVHHSTATTTSRWGRFSMGVSNVGYPTFLELISESSKTNVRNYDPSIGSGGFRTSVSVPLKSLQLLPGMLMDNSSLTIEVLNLDRANSMVSVQIPVTRAANKRKCSGCSGLCSWLRQPCRRTKTLSTRPLYRDDIFYDQSLIRMSRYNHQAGSLNDANYHLAVTRVTTRKDMEEDTADRVVFCSEALKRTLATMLDLSPLRSPSFLIYLAASVLLTSVYYVPHLYMPERARLKGVDPAITPLFASTISASQLVGRIACGLVASLRCTNPYLIINVATAAMGVAVIVSNLCITVVHQLLCCALYGFAIACNSNLRTVVLVEMLGLDKLTNAFGLLLLFQGVFSIMGPPFAGWMKEITGSYDAVFYFAGSVGLLSAVILLPLSYMRRRARVSEARETKVEP